VRDWYQIKTYRLSDSGHCPQCDAKIAGHFEHVDLNQQFGPRRIPVVMHAVR